MPYPRRPLNNSPTDGTDAHRWFGCVGFSHGIHGIHRSFWRRRASHRFHRCTQMVRLRKVLWEDSLVSAWVWQGCHTLLQLHRLGGLKFCVFCAIRGRISQQEISVRICAICGRISQQEVSVGSVASVGGCSGCLVGALLALLVQMGQQHPLLGRCKKSIDFFVVTKFRCIFAM